MHCGGNSFEVLPQSKLYKPAHHQEIEGFVLKEFSLSEISPVYYSLSLEDIQIQCNADYSAKELNALAIAACTDFETQRIWINEAGKDSCYHVVHELTHIALSITTGDEDFYHTSDAFAKGYHYCDEMGF